MTWLSLVTTVTLISGFVGMAVLHLLGLSLRAQEASTARQQWNRKMLAAGVCAAGAGIVIPFLALGWIKAAFFGFGWLALGILGAAMFASRYRPVSWPRCCFSRRRCTPSCGFPRARGPLMPSVCSWSPGWHWRRSPASPSADRTCRGGSAKPIVGVTVQPGWLLSRPADCARPVRSLRPRRARWCR